MSFNQFILKEQYEKVKGLGDRLELMKEQIEWKPFVPLVSKIFHDNEKEVGRPHTDELVIVRSMLLQGWYGLSDPELEFQCHDRLSFRNFLGFPEIIPDFTTIWKTRDKLKEKGIDDKIWNELQRQLDEKGYKIKKRVIQDTTFIECDLGRKRHYKEKQAKKKGDKLAYHDKGYFDKKLKAGNVEDMTMKRGTRARKINGGEQKRNKMISRIRAPGELPFGVIKRVFNGGRTLVKTLERVRIKEVFKCFAFDLYQLVTLERKKLAVAM